MAGGSLKVVANFGVGYDNFDVEEVRGEASGRPSRRACSRMPPRSSRSR